MAITRNIIIDRHGIERADLFWMPTGSDVADGNLQSRDDAMTKKTQLLLGLIALSVIDAVAPLLPVLGLVLIYVVLAKPRWFLEIVRQVYNMR